MDRRLLLLASLLPLAVAGCAGMGPQQYLLTTQRLQDALAARFPLRRELAGLATLDLRMPRLRLLPEQNRLLAQVLLELGGPALGRNYTGGLDLGFALRYEPSDQTLRAHQLQVQNLRLPGLSGRPAQLVEAALPTLLRELLGEVVLHQLRPQELAVASRLGLELQALTVRPDGVLLQLAPVR